MQNEGIPLVNENTRNQKEEILLKMRFLKVNLNRGLFVCSNFSYNNIWNDI